MNTIKPALSQILATAQLAEMAYNADQTDHKKAAWDKAQTEYEQAKQEAETEPGLEPYLVTLAINDQATGKTEMLAKIVDELRQSNAGLGRDLNTVVEENTLLKNQLIEKEEKIKELEKLALSANPATPEVPPAAAPAVTPVIAPAATPAAPKPLVGAAKVAAEKKAAALAEEEAKKNS